MARAADSSSVAAATVKQGDGAAQHTVAVGVKVLRITVEAGVSSTTARSGCRNDILIHV